MRHYLCTIAQSQGPEDVKAAIKQLDAQLDVLREQAEAAAKELLSKHR
jgi:hypothetical protein